MQQPVPALSGKSRMAGIPDCMFSNNCTSLVPVQDLFFPVAVGFKITVISRQARLRHPSCINDRQHRNRYVSTRCETVVTAILTNQPQKCEHT